MMYFSYLRALKYHHLFNISYLDIKKTSILVNLLDYLK